ncbi:hypothetical protein BD779DRAFT_1113967 [Infundibulicybe gibba]|nr:hypothetical protein BD779DRAFT_1113967 [Infundibulicybe gibba]
MLMSRVEDRCILRLVLRLTTRSHSRMTISNDYLKHGFSMNAMQRPPGEQILGRADMQTRGRVGESANQSKPAALISVRSQSKSLQVEKATSPRNDLNLNATWKVHASPRDTCSYLNDRISGSLCRPSCHGFHMLFRVYPCYTALGRAPADADQCGGEVLGRAIWRFGILEARRIGLF